MGNMDLVNREEEHTVPEMEEVKDENNASNIPNNHIQSVSIHNTS